VALAASKEQKGGGEEGRIWQKKRVNANRYTFEKLHENGASMETKKRNIISAGMEVPKVQ